MTTTALPNVRVEPYLVAADTHVIPQLVPAPPIGLVYINSLVITGSEPILVDTGTRPSPGAGCRHGRGLSLIHI